MKISENYVLRTIGGTPYLMPFGQNIAIHKHSIQLNESALLIWHALQTNQDPKYLLDVMCRHYEPATTEETAILKQDLELFLNQLISIGILVDDLDNSCSIHYLNIADIVIAYKGPAHLLAPSLLDFSCEESTPMQHWTVIAATPATLPDGKVIIHTADVTILMNDDFYTVIYPADSQIMEARISLDGVDADFYIKNGCMNQVREDLFHSFRFAFLLIAQMQDCVVLHSASLLYQNRAWLFSGPSGTGKSTHTNLWHDIYQTPILDGDLNLIRMIGDQPFIYGIPWCGTSGIYTTKKYPLGGIIMLKQHPSDEVVTLDDTAKQLMVMQRFISPTWTESMFDCNLRVAGQLIRTTPVYQLLCTPNTSAVNTIKTKIDQLTMLSQ